MLDDVEVLEVLRVEIDEDADVIDVHLAYLSHIGDWAPLVLEEALVERTDEVELDDWMLIIQTHRMQYEMLDVMLQIYVDETEQTEPNEMMEAVIGQTIDDDEVDEDIEFVIEVTDEIEVIETSETDEVDEDEDSDGMVVEMVETDDGEIVLTAEETDEGDEIVIGEMLESDERLDLHILELTILYELPDVVETDETHTMETEEMVETITTDVRL